MKSLIIYDSQTENTEKISHTIYGTLFNLRNNTTIIKINGDIQIDIPGYDLVFIGSPIIDWLPTQSMVKFVKASMKSCADNKLIQPSSPKLTGKYAVCFCTYGGPHIAEREAIPATMWLRSFIEHLGFTTLGLWHISGQFVTHPQANSLNTKGRLGNIVGRPNENDLKEVSERVTGLYRSLSNTVLK